MFTRLGSLALQRSISEGESKADESAHLVRCVRAQEIEKTLTEEDFNPVDEYYKLAALVRAYVGAFRHQAHQTTSDDIGRKAAPRRRFEVNDLDTNKVLVFDTIGCDQWGPISENEGFNPMEMIPEYYNEVTLYRHETGAWTLVTEREHREVGRLDIPDARRLSDAEAADWLVRHDCEPPTDIERLAVDTLYNPDQPGDTRARAASVAMPAEDGWFLFYRPVRLATSDEGAVYPCVSTDEWNVFIYFADLTADEVRLLLRVLAHDGRECEFDAKQAAELAKDPVGYIRFRRAWTKILQEEGSPLGSHDQLFYDLRMAAEGFAEEIRAIRGTGRPVTVSPSAALQKTIPGATECRREESGETPHWNRSRGELTLDGKVVRRVPRPGVAKNVVRVLDAFQEDGWPDRVDDPLPGGRDQKRVHETVKRLNDGLERIRFRADGTGQGFRWERV